MVQIVRFYRIYRIEFIKFTVLKSIYRTVFTEGR